MLSLNGLTIFTSSEITGSTSSVIVEVVIYFTPGFEDLSKFLVAINKEITTVKSTIPYKTGNTNGLNFFLVYIISPH